MDSIGSYKKKITQELSEKINLTLREAELEAQFIMQHVLKESSSNLIIKKNEIVLKKDIANIENIIRDNRGNMDSLILNLSKLPLSDLNSDTNNPYYVKLAKEKKAELERESKATYVHPQKIINELTKISKNSNPRYREKVAFNKRNNLDYKGRPKK